MPPVKGMATGLASGGRASHQKLSTACYWQRDGRHTYCNMRHMHKNSLCASIILLSATLIGCATEAPTDGEYGDESAFTLGPRKLKRGEGFSVHGSGVEIEIDQPSTGIISRIDITSSNCTIRRSSYTTQTGDEIVSAVGTDHRNCQFTITNANWIQSVTLLHTTVSPLQ